MTDDSGDVLERNEQLNKQVAGFASTYTRRRVVDTLLSILIVLSSAILIILLIADYDLEHQIDNTDVRETQLICEHLDHPEKYTACQDVGAPKEIDGGIER